MKPADAVAGKVFCDNVKVGGAGGVPGAGILSETKDRGVGETLQGPVGMKSSMPYPKLSPEIQNFLYFCISLFQVLVAVVRFNPLIFR
jgi:hypothetical protein